METFTIKDMKVGDKFYMEGHFTGGNAILELCKLVSNGGNKPIVDTQHGKVEVDYEDRIFPKKSS